ncbi:hypothetical protein J6590_071336 [Homalodisca vitripennis]|nr:hypothetical protein J6590_071336 [Homalodisca vitripennis]
MEKGTVAQGASEIRNDRPEVLSDLQRGRACEWEERFATSARRARTSTLTSAMATDIPCNRQHYCSSRDWMKLN